MLSPLIKSVLPQRVLYPQRRRYRDSPATKIKDGVSIVRLMSFFFGGLLAANLVLMMSATFGSPAAQPSPDTVANALAKRGPAAAVAARQKTIVTAATDGRAVQELEETASAAIQPAPVVATINQHCAAHAREKLLVGLTNYYLQRRLRPGASSDDAAETSMLTGTLAGPGDPAATTPESACQG